MQNVAILTMTPMLFGWNISEVSAFFRLLSSLTLYCRCSLPAFKNDLSFIDHQKWKSAFESLHAFFGRLCRGQVEQNQPFQFAKSTLKNFVDPTASEGA